MLNNKKMKNRRVIIAALVFMAALVGAEKVLETDIDVYRDDRVVINSLRVTNGYETLLIPEGKYRLDILNSRGNVMRSIPMDPSFVIYTDPPAEMDHATIALRIDYSEDMYAIKIYNSGKEIYSGLINTCDNDGVCETSSESSLSCPKDCPLDKPDGICVALSDGLCDPDCIAGADPDCNMPLPLNPCNRDGICEIYAGESEENCPDDCAAPPVADGCVEEGNSIDTGGKKHCCKGLTAIGCNKPDAHGGCTTPLCESFTCANCGNGVCGIGENACNCPSDCGATTSSSIQKSTSTLSVTSTTLKAGALGDPYYSIYALFVLALLIIVCYLIIYKRRNKE